MQVAQSVPHGGAEVASEGYRCLDDFLCLIIFLKHALVQMTHSIELT